MPFTIKIYNNSNLPLSEDLKKEINKSNNADVKLVNLGGFNYTKFHTKLVSKSSLIAKMVFFSIITLGLFPLIYYKKTNGKEDFKNIFNGRISHYVPNSIVEKIRQQGLQQLPSNSGQPSENLGNSSLPNPNSSINNPNSPFSFPPVNNILNPQLVSQQLPSHQQPTIQQRKPIIPKTQPTPITTNASAIPQVSSIQKINEDLYVGRRAQDTDLCFCFSRLTDANLEIWEKLWGKSLIVHTRKFEKIIDDSWSSAQKKFILNEIQGGAMAFRDTLEMFRESKEKLHRPEIWIAYALSGQTIEPNQPVSERLFDNMEMVLTVLTHPEIPVTVHMGIGRTGQNTAKFYKNELPKHAGISMPLHAFAAKAIMNTPNGHSKLWMRTMPTYDMANILDKSLPQTSYYKGRENMPIKLNDNGSVDVFGPSGNLEVHISQQDVADGKYDFIKHNQMDQPLTDYAIQFPILSSLF